MAKLTGQRTLRLLGEEAQALADHLDELPTVIAEIELNPNHEGPRLKWSTSSDLT